MKKMIRNISGVLGGVCGTSVFLFWLSLVGNPHVVETVIGLVLGIAVGLFVWLKLRRFGEITSKDA